MLDEDAYSGGQSAAGRSECKDRHSSFEECQKAYGRTFSKFGGEEPRWRLGYAEMFQDTHPQLFNIVGSKDSCRDNALRILSGAEYGQKR
jgi:hypothetical protein